MKSFFALLDRLNVAPDESRADIERFIWETFQCDKAVLALDMSGFSTSVRRNGILPYLCQIRRMQLLTGPVLRDYDGELVKYEADNLLAVFDDPRQAVEAAIAINRIVLTSSPSSRAGSPLEVCIGIDYGRLLLVPGTDCFGDPKNIAYKLGEDVARPGEILITKEMRERLGENPPFQLEEMVLSLSGLELVAYKVLY